MITPERGVPASCSRLRLVIAGRRRSWRPGTVAADQATSSWQVLGAMSRPRLPRPDRARRAWALLTDPRRLRKRLLARYAFLDHLMSLWAISLARRRRLNRLWIGDSHAAFLAGLSLQRFSVSKEEAVIWLGPRLMYSLARDGFPDPLIAELKGVRVDLTTTSIVLTCGEIDCRVHLVGRLHDENALDFTSLYVVSAAQLRARMGAKHAYLLGPVPPSDIGGDDPGFPRTGTLDERVTASRLLEKRLCEEAAASEESGISAIPLGAILADPKTGALAAEFTNDGCHVNCRGAELVRERLEEAMAQRKQ